ncbi:MAG: Hsp20/alpha crystallin family protein [Planctomycetes bacterium]|nr:Hsp20/alpha crystallin family protein [Planctomycetota bacterium]MCP4840076.1 Hsp20/alpha crystallin family protein [Planctomycetota bacterium]
MNNFTTTGTNNEMTCCNTTPKESCGTETVKRPQNYRAPVDVYETESAFCVIADMPGTRSDNIAISVESNMLTIDAKVRDRYAAMGTLRHQEYGVGDYHRSFRIGDGVNAEAITATYSNGVLEVNLPKAEAVVPRKIDIRTH